MSTGKTIVAGTAVILVLLSAVAVIGILLYQKQQAQRPIYTVELLQGNAGGYSYRTFDPESRGSASSATFEVFQGSDVRIEVGVGFDMDLYRMPGFVVNGDNVGGGMVLWLKDVGQNTTVSQMAMVPTEYKVSLNLLAANSLTVVESENVYCTGLDCQYASKARMDIESFIGLANQVGVVAVNHVKSYTGGIERHALWDPMYQWFWFIDRSTLYYVRMNA